MISIQAAKYATMALLLLATHALAFIPSASRFSVGRSSPFSLPLSVVQKQQGRQTQRVVMSPLYSGYVPPSQEDFTVKARPLYPKIGDIIRYYDLDGGRADGEVLVGKISFLSKSIGTQNSWVVEITELENVGDGYFAEYPSRKRNSKKTTRTLEDVAPIAASFVRAEAAFKVPRELGSDIPQVRAEQYTIEGFEGPMAITEDMDVEAIQADAELYAELKFELLRNAAIAGVVGALIADLSKGQEIAIIYAAGAFAGLGYLFFLSLKTDTVASTESKLGANISNVRFALPLIVVVGVAIYNLTQGDASPVVNANLLNTVSPEQFAAIVIGFLTYRIPLFASQLAPIFKESAGSLLPGSAGVALQLATDNEEATESANKDGLTPVLLVSGPPGTGKSELVKRLIEESEGKFIPPTLVDSVKEGAAFEQLLRREEFLKVDGEGRYGMTRKGIMEAAADSDGESVVVVDADVELAKAIIRIPGARVIGVWVGLDSMEKFETRLKEDIESGAIPIPEDETKETVLRSKKREIAQDIEYGVVSGVFEFTVLNDEFDSSLEQLKFASEYCFK
mmetsp:Transcript_5163/g.7853  ORF Transcript_5163/g.7853 Transcript_5163/m.7853 type:complete len:566 (-) Transcript_5163:85-1782(-)|eukprot:CAMPEP_0195297442 /NCGR_PEP_ID=MMETSP0707-20130614/21521_1 /TAXON_ID=33640 /ORGANISM="Asterionellopsis glacialis, Strain CCMP134" /LENGTH=565 /DNA_ID=CAMNT_0040359253 /DNA_START=92 /DNA_END=1789 /DNA_ORIENTATION=+